MYKGVSSDKVSVSNSFIWLKHGNITSKREAALCFLRQKYVLGRGYEMSSL